MTHTFSICINFDVFVVFVVFVVAAAAAAAVVVVVVFVVVVVVVACVGVPTCKLDCYNVKYDYVRALADHVIDGTPCTYDSKDICISGRCVPVGCDGHLHALENDTNIKLNDVCGQCGGDNSTCYEISTKWRAWRDAKGSYKYFLVVLTIYTRIDLPRFFILSPPF